MSTAHAADMPAPAAAAATAPCKAAVSLPVMGGALKANPNPACFTIDGFGDIYVGGVVSGYAYGQTNPFSSTLAPLPSIQGDREARVDFTNLQATIQKVDGPLQFYIQTGIYANPTLGFANYRTLDQTDQLFGPLPVAFGKIVLNVNWSVQGGRMPSLIGAELPFTFQNLNIQRGLLLVQENIINHGFQLNYADGPLSASVAGTDGFFSGKLSWMTGTISYKVDDANTFTFSAGTNLDRTNRNTFATPLLQNKSEIYNLIYTYTNGPWIVMPYFQYTNVQRDVRLGILQSASTYGGALLASYAFTDNFALAGRVEYEAQSGDPNALFAGSVPNLVYGPGSSALSVTVTPTFTFDRYFVRGEYSHVQLFDITRGDLTVGTLGTGFGRTGNRTSQDRYMIETGIVF